MGQIDYSELLAFILVGFALMGSPGPASLSLAAMGAAYGVRTARNYLFGLTLAAMAVVVGVAAGMFAAIIAIPHAAEVLTVTAMAYLGYLAFKIATAPPVGEAASSTDGPGFMTGVFLNLSNPKAYAAFAALFSGFQLIPESAAQSTYFQVFVCFAILCIVNPAWLLAGNALRHILRNETTSRRVNLGFAVLLVASVLMAVFL